MNNDYEQGEFEVLNLLSSVWYGKQYYFIQDNGFIYSKASGKYMKLEEAVEEFAKAIGDDENV